MAAACGCVLVGLNLTNACLFLTVSALDLHGAVLRLLALRQDGLDKELEVVRARVAGGLEHVHLLGGGRHSELGLCLVRTNCLLT